VDDFGVQYFSQNDADHLIQALQDKYIITMDKSGKHFVGLDLKWNYSQGWVDISMPNFVRNTLKKLKYVQHKKPQYAPHIWNVPIYGKNRQFAQEKDKSPKLNPAYTKYIQQVVGSFLYFARAIDNTILPAINEIASTQSSPTQKTLTKSQMLLDYMNTYPNPKIRYNASDMILYIDSDAAYLVAEKAKSRISGYYYLSNKDDSKIPTPPLNGALHVECKLLRHVVTSAAEAETAGLLYNCQTAIDLRNMLSALGHKQASTPVKTDNSTAASFVKNLIKQRRSKSWDVRYHWLSEKQKDKTFNIYWDRGQNNLGDYHSKHHSPSYHKK